jgi:hypothetical protein
LVVHPRTAADTRYVNGTPGELNELALLDRGRHPVVYEGETT